MTAFIIYLIGCIFAVTFPKQIMILGYLTMCTEPDDDGKPYFDSTSTDDFPQWLYILFVFFLSWISVIMIYVTTIIHILINKMTRK